MTTRVSKKADLGPLRKDVAALREEAAGRQSDDAAGRRRGPPRAALWRRRLVALLVVAAIVFAGWYFFLNRRNTDFAGTWEGSQALLGSDRLVIKKNGSAFTIKGLEIHGQPPSETHVDDGKLYATGESNGETWTVRFEVASDGRQLWAYYDRGDDSPELRLRLNRVPD